MSKLLFTSPLTPDEAYWAGVIHADGSLSHKNKRVVLGQKDKHMIEEFLKFVGQDSKISHYRKETAFGIGEGYLASTMKGYDGLVTAGVKGDICQSLYKSRHFWRGLIDGDGGVYRVGKGKVPFISLCSGKGPRDIEAYCRWVGTLFNYEGPKPYIDKKGVWYGNIGAGKARLLGPYLYEDGYSAVPRKRDLALSFSQIWTQSRVRLILPKDDIVMLDEIVTLWRD